MSAPAVPGLEVAFRVEARLGPPEDHGVTRAAKRGRYTAYRLT
ncbi:hypothetical protein [Nocardia violaceofusca]|nr:hypothetical protein [Nocardia violaceofusca]